MTDWRLQIVETRRAWIRRWFWAVATLTLCVLIVGGATRLTHSGLSMVEWQPILGIVPPTSSADWQHRFEQYKQFPEYQKLRQGMTLHEFKVIFYWEYMHRVLARSIGIVFLVPFLFFLLRGWMPRTLAWRSAGLFGLGAMQGLMGWLMVASGLVDRPSVSHYRLAAHLSLAFIIFGYAVWLARELAVNANRPVVERAALRRMKRGIAVVGVMLGVQVIYGAFVAGLKAGFFANTFPRMDLYWIHPRMLLYKPVTSNFFMNPVTVQWMHRWIGAALAIAVVVVAGQTLAAKLDARSKRIALVMIGAVLLQFTLGVLTLLHAVPVPLGVTHQAMAMVLFGIWVTWLHHSHAGVVLEDDAERNQDSVAENNEQRRAHV